MSPASSLLAFDSAGSACSAAVLRAGRVAAARFEPMARGQSERLVPMIEEVMREAGLAFTDLEGLAVTCGPGGFTGVRIGLATARGLALALDCPVLGLSSFEAVAASLRPEERSGRPVAILLDAKRRDLYLQCFDRDLVPAGPARAVDPDDLATVLPAEPLLLAGDGLPALTPARLNPQWVLSERAHAEAALFLPSAAARGLPVEGDLPRPIYLRAPDVTLPGRAGSPSAGKAGALRAR